MNVPPELRTQRTLLRAWRTEDLAPFARLNADPRVAEFFPSTLTPAQSDALVESFIRHFQERGYGLWALEIPGRTPFAGFVGLVSAPFERPFRACPEVAWRLAAEHWGQGFAPEAASAVLDHAFDTLGFSRIISCTVAANQRSRRVMEKLGMVRDVDADFDHPRVTQGHPLKPHVLYRIDARQWRGA